MANVQWWGAQRQIDPTTPLTTRLDKAFSAEEPIFDFAQKMTITLRGVMVLEAHDFDKKNDLMMVTTTQFGDGAPIPRLHFMKNDVKPGWRGDLFDDVVLTMRDLQDGCRRLTMRVQVYDLDSVPTKLFKSVATMAAGGVSMLFPALMPYATIGAAGVSAVAGLIDDLNQHDEIIDQQVTLVVSEPGVGSKLLQPGYFVCFGDGVDESRDLFINHNLRLVNADGVAEFTDCSYAVLEIERAVEADRKRELDQQAARLIAELDGKDTSQVPLDFLRDVLDASDKFQRLQRAQALINKEKVGTLTPAEQDLLEELRSDIALNPHLAAVLPVTDGG